MLLAEKSINFSTYAVDFICDTAELQEVLLRKESLLLFLCPSY